MSWLDRFLNERAQDRRGAQEETPRDEVLDVLCSGLPWEDAQALRDERAAILEHEAGMSREEAERRAGLAGSGGVEGAQNGAHLRNIA